MFRRQRQIDPVVKALADMINRDAPFLAPRVDQWEYHGGVAPSQVVIVQIAPGASDRAVYMRDSVGWLMCPVVAGRPDPHADRLAPLGASPAAVCSVFFEQLVSIYDDLIVTVSSGTVIYELLTSHRQALAVLLRARSVNVSVMPAPRPPATTWERELAASGVDAPGEEYDFGGYVTPEDEPDPQSYSYPMRYWLAGRLVAIAQARGAEHDRQNAELLEQLVAKTVEVEDALLGSLAIDGLGELLTATSVTVARPGDLQAGIQWAKDSGSVWILEVRDELLARIATVDSQLLEGLELALMTGYEPGRGSPQSSP